MSTPGRSYFRNQLKQVAAHRYRTPEQTDKILLAKLRAQAKPLSRAEIHRLWQGVGRQTVRNALDRLVARYLVNKLVGAWHKPLYETPKEKAPGPREVQAPTSPWAGASSVFDGR